jgi:soluble P-type ATPase
MINKDTRKKKREVREAYNKNSERLQRRAELVTKVGGGVNVVLAGFKGFVGLSIGSTGIKKKKEVVYIILQQYREIYNLFVDLQH